MREGKRKASPESLKRIQDSIQADRDRMEKIRNEANGETEEAEQESLKIVSTGMGQDSNAITELILKGEISRKNTVLVFADTGNERKETYDHAWKTLEVCRSHGIALFHLAHEDTVIMHGRNGRNTSHILTGFHSDSWSSLQGQYARNHNLAIRRNKSCTDNLKIKPIYRWLDFYCSQLLGKESRKHEGKKHIIEYAEKFGKIEVMIGFSKGEESRAKKAAKPQRQKWWQSIEKTFPLIDRDIDRLGCIEIAERSELGTCPPSMCQMCPNISKQTLVLMWLKNRKSFIAWCRHERNKLNKWGNIQASKGAKNPGALGREKNLIEELREALKELSGWTLQELEAHEFTHGHCISNGY